MKFNYQGIEYKLILFTLAGSRFYGTHFDGPDSDRVHPLKPEYVSDCDYRGIFIANPDTKVGLTGAIEQIEVKKGKDGTVPLVQQELIKELNEKLGMDMPLDEDIALYEIKKFVVMALEANPNILDLLYADEDATIYSNKKGKKFLENKDIFLSKKTKYTFSGYAASQLARIRGHYKMLTKYPKVNTVIKQLRDALNEELIDFNWITDHFGGNVSKYVTGITQEEASALGKIQSIDWEEFVKTREASLEDFTKGAIEADYSAEKELEMMNKVMFKGEWDNYRKPQLINYCTAKDLKAHKLPMDSEMHIYRKNSGSSDGGRIQRPTVREFLLNQASFRTISKTQYNIFTPDVKYHEEFKGGIFGRNGKLKVNDPEEVGEFQFQLSINENEFKKDTDAIAKLWEWRTKRNEKRSILEEAFGYDTKHAAHLVRLLLGAQNILREGDYRPRLDGADLKLVQDTLAGKYSYEEVVAMSVKYEKALEPLYEATTLPHTADHKKANELLLKLSRKF